MMKKLLIFALAAFAFAACNEDDVNTLNNHGNGGEPDPATEYTIEVISGVAKVADVVVDKAVEGVEVTLTHEQRLDHDFTGWHSEDVTIDQTTGKFTMPAKNVTVEAQYVGVAYSITVEDGGKAMVDGEEVLEAEVGVEVTLVAEVRDGYEFLGWEGVEYADDKFIMPNHSVTITPVYEALAQTLTLVDCTSSPAAADVKTGTVVTLTPDTKTGYVFKNWTTDATDVTIAADNTFTMPAHAVTVTANFDAVSYTITTTNCTSSPSGTAIYEQEVTLTWTPQAGKMFDHWVVTPSTVTITDSKFTMPAENVTVEAVFVADNAAKTGYILYWDTSTGTGDSATLNVGTWGTVTYDNILYTKFGSVLAFTYNTTWDTTNGNVKNNYTMIAPNFADYSKIPAMDGTPGNVVGFVTANHNAENLGYNSAKGDICKLVGLTLGQMKQKGGVMGDGSLATYDSGYRLPTQAEMGVLYPGNRLEGITLNGTIGVTIDGTAATFLPHAGQVADAQGDGNTILSQRDTFGMWWTADCVSAAMMPTMFSAYGAYRTMPPASSTGNSRQDVNRTGNTVRCIKNGEIATN